MLEEFYVTLTDRDSGVAKFIKRGKHIDIYVALPDDLDAWDFSETVSNKSFRNLYESIKRGEQGKDVIVGDNLESVLMLKELVY